jgi:hypothetical protein
MVFATRLSRFNISEQHTAYYGAAPPFARGATLNARQNNADERRREHGRRQHLDNMDVRVILMPPCEFN